MTPMLAHLGPLLGLPGARRMEKRIKVVCCVCEFILIYLRCPRRSQEVPMRAPKGAQDRPTGVQEKPKTASGRPQGSSKMAPRRPKSRPRASFTMSGPLSDVYDLSGCSKKPPRGPQDTPGPTLRILPWGSGGLKRVPNLEQFDSRGGSIRCP